MDLSKNDYNVLIMLYQQECTNELKSYTLQQIHQNTNLSISKLRDTIKAFRLLNYINDGLVNNKSKTYYITQQGIEKLTQLGVLG